VKLTREETIESWGYPDVKTTWSYSWSHFDLIPDYDWQTDRRTESVIAMLTRCKNPPGNMGVMVQNKLARFYGTHGVYRILVQEQ